MNRNRELNEFGQSLWYDAIQRRMLENGEFKRLMVFGDWEHYYLTMNPRYQADIARALDLIARFEKHLDVIFGLNEKESSEIGKVLGALDRLGLADKTIVVRVDSIEKMHTQVGIDDCSTDLNLRGLPVFQSHGRYDDVLPYFKKSEHFAGPADPSRGTGGRSLRTCSSLLICRYSLG